MHDRRAVVPVWGGGVGRNWAGLHEERPGIFGLLKCLRHDWSSLLTKLGIS